MSLRSYDLDASWDTLWCSSSGRLATRLCSSADTSVKSAAVLSSRQAASASAVKHAAPGSGACRSPAARQYTSTLTCTPGRSMKTTIVAEHMAAAHGAVPLHEPSNFPPATRRMHRPERHQISKCSSLERLEGMLCRIGPCSSGRRGTVHAAQLAACAKHGCAGAHLRHALLEILESEAPLPFGGWLGCPIIAGLAARHVACCRSCRTVTAALTWVLSVKCRPCNILVAANAADPGLPTCLLVSAGLACQFWPSNTALGTGCMHMAF